MIEQEHELEIVKRLLKKVEKLQIEEQMQNSIADVDIENVKDILKNIRIFGDLRRYQVTKPFSDFEKMNVKEWVLWFIKFNEWHGWTPEDREVMKLLESIDGQLQIQANRAEEALRKLLNALEIKEKYIEQLKEEVLKKNEEIVNIKENNNKNVEEEVKKEISEEKSEESEKPKESEKPEESEEEREFREKMHRLAEHARKSDEKINKKK